MLLLPRPLLFGLSFQSGLLGPGVAFIAIPWPGARFTAGKVKSATLSRIFAVALILLAAQRAWILLS